MYSSFGFKCILSGGTKLPLRVIFFESSHRNKLECYLETNHNLVSKKQCFYQKSKENAQQQKTEQNVLWNKKKF
jgi:hypothetical protein